MKKKPFNRVRYASYRQISDKACVVHCYDGSKSILPLSQIIHESDAILVPNWITGRLLYIMLQAIAAVSVMFILPAMVAVFAIAFGVGGY